MYDQSRMFKHEKPYFYYATEDPSKLTSNEKQEIEKHRIEYGVKPFESTKIKVIGKMLIQRTLW